MNSPSDASMSVLQLSFLYFYPCSHLQYNAQYYIKQMKRQKGIEEESLIESVIPNIPSS